MDGFLAGRRLILLHFGDGWKSGATGSALHLIVREGDQRSNCAMKISMWPEAKEDKVSGGNGRDG